MPVSTKTQSLEENKSTKEPTKKEKFHEEVKNFVSTMQEPKQSESEQVTNEKLVESSEKGFRSSTIDPKEIIKYVSAGAKIGYTGEDIKGVYSEEKKGRDR